MKHTMKRVPIGNGEYFPQRYEYRGYEIHKADTYSWGIMYMRGTFFNTRAEAAAWIDKRIAAREAQKENAQ